MRVEILLWAVLFALGVALGAMFVWWRMRGVLGAVELRLRGIESSAAGAIAERDALRHGLAKSQQDLSATAARERAVAAESAHRAAENAALAARLEHAQTWRPRAEALEAERSRVAGELAAAERRNAELGARLSAELDKAAERQKLLESTGERMRAEFQTLAAQILEDKSKRFTEQNVQQIGSLLDPMREQLGEFRKAVGEAYDKESRERLLLKAEIEQIRNLNVRLSEDAHNLTRALKGDSRAQGHWGELALERLLEASGLTRGREYETQLSFNDAQGDRFRPDVLVRLPEGRHIVIDAKVSLTSYERFCAATDEAERTIQLAEHLGSLRSHVRQLGEKGYAQLDGVSSLDFVLLFVPVEAAFIEAVRHDDTLYDFALAKNIVIVCPSTLLATLRIVSNLWRIETQNRNARLIAKKAGGLYDKFTGFVADMDKVGKALTDAQSAHDQAMGKLKQGKGNLVRRTEQLRQLGATSSKRLGQTLIDEASGDEDIEAGPVEVPEP
jgi:DNA recombination protein RmuC